ncbi:NADP-dependent oxidoreductase [Chitinophaga sp.]|uniref:NADP-dependent oxidoreductase n=1 Tax=Chitinophaga sp. TaxID=1869181 RepID=UPI0031D160D6
MKAIILTTPGTTDNFSYRNIELPHIKDQEVLIEVKSISINPIDIKTRKGQGAFLYANLDPAKEYILGWDISGVVTQSHSPAFKPGDEVFGMVNFPGIGATYAEYVAAPANQLAKKPANISHAEAAGATLAALTAWQNIVNKGTVKPGDRILIHAAAGGVGHYAVQIAKHFGAYVIGTSSAANKDFVLSLGADEHIDYKTRQLVENVDPVDLVIDGLGYQSALDSLDLIKPGGMLISISAPITPETREKAAKFSIAAEFTSVRPNGTDMNSLAEVLHSGAIRSYISKTFAFIGMAEAHHAIESGRTIGKIVVNL